MAPAKLFSIVGRQLPPTPWAEGDNIPWQDPAFSERMLVEHLSQQHDLASRRASSIDAHIHFIERQLRGLDNAHILDLGCGPGLYLHRLARLGHRGHGIDFSPAAIDYARGVAAREELDCHFEQADLRHANFGEGFDLVLLLYGQIKRVHASARARHPATRSRGARTRRQASARAADARGRPRLGGHPQRTGPRRSKASSRASPTCCCTSGSGTSLHARPRNAGMSSTPRPGPSNATQCPPAVTTVMSW